jgi:hypothetical protein
VIKGPIFKNGWNGFYLTIIQYEIEQPWKWKHISCYSPSYPLEIILNTIENIPTMEIFKVLFSLIFKNIFYMIQTTLN